MSTCVVIYFILDPPDKLTCLHLSKRKGVDKAIHQLEQAIKHPKSGDSNASQKIISNLQDLLNKAQSQSLPSESDDLQETLGESHDIVPPKATNTDENLALDDAENPLQLLARASDLQLSPGEVQGPKLPLPSRTSTFQAENCEPDRLGANSFFVPVRASRDIGPDLDPIDVGLVTLHEAESLFTLYAHVGPQKTLKLTPNIVVSIKISHIPDGDSIP